MLRVSVLLAALLVNAPTIWAALGSQTIDVDAALIRFLVSIPIMALLLGGVRAALNPAAQPGKARDEAKPPVID